VPTRAALFACPLAATLAAAAWGASGAAASALTAGASDRIAFRSFRDGLYEIYAMSAGGAGR